MLGLVAKRGYSGFAQSGGFAEVASVWNKASRTPALRSVGRWDTSSDGEIASHLVGVSRVTPWWDVVQKECPLVVSPVAEDSICQVRKHLVRLLALNPGCLPEESLDSLLKLAESLASQAQQSEHAYLVSQEEIGWVHQASSSGDPTWSSVARALLPAFPSHAQNANVPTLSQDDVVQRFYERDPYPRWRDLQHWDVATLPAALVRAGTPGNRILIAGCGTGRWACNFAHCFPGVSVLAVDISQASLAFARGQKSKFALHNLEFEHADLRTWNRHGQFDFIECTGVLHHLPDPLTAWARLVSALKQDGAMLVALYSKMARWPFKEMRRSILPQVAPGMDVDAADLHELDDHTVRLFRQKLLAEIWNPDLIAVARCPDFHGLSRLRDCFFHPLEHEYTLLEVRAMLRDLQLELLGLHGHGFDHMFARRKRGRDPRDLEAWHELEQEMPGIFLGMYRMFVQKA